MNGADKRNRILIVEDEALVGVALEEFLVEQGYEVPRVIDSVDDVLPAIRDCRPDLVLMDVKLKSFNDGIDAAWRLRLFSSIPLIFLTAYTDDATRQRAAGIGNSALLAKPLDENRLAKEIARMLS